jgi:hypothetical protein
VPFDSRHFGASYPNGNKAEGLAALPGGRPFLFFDTDTLVTGPRLGDPLRLRPPLGLDGRTDTWPVIELYGPGYAETWGRSTTASGSTSTGSLDLTQPDEHWRRYLYFNAGWFFGPCPRDLRRAA